MNERGNDLERVTRLEPGARAALPLRAVHTPTAGEWWRGAHSRSAGERWRGAHSRSDGERWIGAHSRPAGEEGTLPLYW